MEVQKRMASNQSTIAEVVLWGRTIGAVSWDDDRQLANFEYDPVFKNSGIELSPLKMPLSEQIYSFPNLSKETFKGLPGLLADSLPDDFGNALIDAWLAREGRQPNSLNPVERLAYMGSRSMGALEYSPARGLTSQESEILNIESLVKLASDILSKKGQLKTSLSSAEEKHSLNKILRVGTSAGGARAKAIIAWNRETDEVRSGQMDAGSGYSYWLLKLDGVAGNKDKESEDPAGYGLIEYAYYKMALAAGIDMEESRILNENGRNHFMTKRFDRTDDGAKLHMQSLAALQHFDYRSPGVYSYEQALLTIRDLDLSIDDIEKQFKRMAFNIIARNQDDHVKNISFLMTPNGKWKLSPAYDVTYSYNPNGSWTGQHQMTLNGKRENFTIEDFNSCAMKNSMKKGRAVDIVKDVHEAVLKWEDYASQVGVAAEKIRKIKNTHRLDILQGTGL